MDFPQARDGWCREAAPPHPQCWVGYGWAGGKSNPDVSSPYGSAIGGNGGVGRVRLDYQTLNGAAHLEGAESLTVPAAEFEGAIP